MTANMQQSRGKSNFPRVLSSPDVGVVEAEGWTTFKKQKNNKPVLNVFSLTERKRRKEETPQALSSG